MILSIVPEASTNIVLNSPHDVKVIDYKTFNTLDIHPFIATNNWEYIYIYLSKGIKSGYIKQVLSKDNIIKVTIPSYVDLDFDIVSKLMEILPNASSELRDAFMHKKDIKSICVREGVIFE